MLSKYMKVQWKGEIQNMMGQLETMEREMIQTDEGEIILMTRN